MALLLLHNFVKWMFVMLIIYILEIYRLDAISCLYRKYLILDDSA